MLGLLLIFFIGKYFYKLSEEFNQNKWLYAILGVVSYYAGTMIVGFIMGILDGLLSLGIDWDNNFGFVLLAIPFGVLASYIFYVLLKKNWQKTVVSSEDEIKNIGEN